MKAIINLGIILILTAAVCYASPTKISVLDFIPMEAYPPTLRPPEPPTLSLPQLRHRLNMIGMWKHVHRLYFQQVIGFR